MRYVVFKTEDEWRIACNVSICAIYNIKSQNNACETCKNCLLNKCFPLYDKVRVVKESIKISNILILGSEEYET